MKIISWNVNGLRSLNCSVKDMLCTLNSDIICFQEIKASRSNVEEENVIVPAFNSYFTFPKYVSGYSGVATFCKDSVRPTHAEEGLSGQQEFSTQNNTYRFQLDLTNFTSEELSSLDNEGRSVTTFHTIRLNGSEQLLAVVNVYCPRLDPEKAERATYKQSFYKLLQARLEAMVENNCHVLIVGDINCSHHPIDNCCPGDLKEFYENPSRRWLTDFLESENKPYKFIDTYRHFHKDTREAYTCWNTSTSARKTNYGTRLDYIFANDALLPYIQDSIILPEIEGSDHCPVAVILQNCEPIPAKQCPRFCTKHWPEFYGTQTSLARFVVQKPLQGPVELGRGTKRRLKDQQVSITSFFQNSKKPANPNTSSKVLDGKVPDINRPLTLIADSIVTSPTESSNDPPTPLTQTSDDRQTKANAWKNILRGPEKPPKCRFHNEPCFLRTVKKEGPNFGKQFYCCSRPVGSSSNREANCNFFVWKVKV